MQVLLFFAEDVKDNSPILVALVSDGSDGALDPNRFPAIQSDGTIYNSTIGRNVTEKVDFGGARDAQQGLHRERAA